MSLFKKKPKVVDQSNVFNQPQPLSGGNSFDVYQDLSMQEQIDKATADQTIKSGVVKSKINELTKKFITERSINPYYLLHLQGNYFCGTCKFECNNPEFKRMIISVIRGAFLWGRAGMFFDRHTGSYFPVYIKNAKQNIFGGYKWIEFSSLYEALNSRDQQPKLRTFKVKGLDCKNLVIFNWGTMCFGAYLYIWPFVKFQNQLLDMSIIQSFTYNKKFSYKIKNTNFVSDEIESFFNPLNPFLLNLSSTDLGNKFEYIDAGGTNTARDFIDYYEKVISIYYHIIGRRINNDDKKERNITSEVEASQENYDIVQSDWLNQFEIFIDQINNHPFKPSDIQIGVIKNEISRVQNDESDTGDSNESLSEDSTNTSESNDSN